MSSKEHEEPPFARRLYELLAARKRTPWGRRLGLNNATLVSMGRGHAPTFPLLERIQRAENVSLSWLLTGIGTPFLVVDGTSEAVMGAIRRTLADDVAPWSALLAVTEKQAALVLYRKIALDEGLPEIVESRVFGGRDHESAYIEVLVGEEERLRGGWSRPLAVKLDHREWLRLAGGWLGTWELWGDGEDLRPRIGQELRRLPGPTEVGQVMSDWFQTPDMVAEHALDTREKELLAAFRALSADDQAKALRILQAMRPPTKQGQEGP